MQDLQGISKGASCHRIGDDERLDESQVHGRGTPGDRAAGETRSTYVITALVEEDAAMPLKFCSEIGVVCLI